MGRPDVKIDPFGERGFLARVAGFADDLASGLFSNAVADALRKHDGVSDAVAGVDSVALRFAPEELSPEEARAALERAIRKTPTKQKAKSKTIDIPVCYGGEYGPDLDALCAEAGLSREDIVKRHAAGDYRVITLGFAPGFAYLSGLDKKLAAPRLATPRARVAPGSIGIASSMTGLYALASPGGWRIIGRTPMALFEPTAATPFLFSPGTRMRFRPISAAEFEMFRKGTK